MTLAVLLALLAAACFGTASALQHHGANRVRRRFPLHPKLLADVARQPLWLLGIVAEVAAVTLHMVAVNFGPLSVVQPLLTLGLVVALPLQAVLGRPVSRRALLAATLTVAGLAVFLVVQPTVESRVPQSVTEWLPGLLLVATVAVPALATSWELWAALGCGLLGALLSLAAFQAGPLGGPLAAMMVIDPVIGVSLGAIVFGESFSTGLLAVIQAAGLALTLAGVWLLATGEQHSGQPPGVPPRGGVLRIARS